MKKSPILIIIICFAIIGLLILGTLGMMGWLVVSNSPAARHDLTCGGIAGLTCPEGYTCVYADEEGIIDAMGTCVMQ